MDNKANLSKVLHYTYRTVFFHLQKQDIIIPNKEEFAMLIATDVATNLSDHMLAF